MALRAATAEDRTFLWEILALAVTADPPWTVARARAEVGVARYLEGWPRAGDVGVVAVDDVGAGGACLGAAWYRSFTPEAAGYGFVDGATPELTIGCVADARGRGIGRALLRDLLGRAERNGVDRLSLSVDPTNLVARRLYAGLGFTPLGGVRPSTSVTLVAATQAGLQHPTERAEASGRDRDRPHRGRQDG